MLDQPVRIFAHFKEICLFLCRFYLPTAIRAFPVHQLGFRPKRLARGTVHSLVCPFINVSLFIKLFKDLLHLFLMPFICRTDKVIIGSIHQVPQLSDRSGHAVHILLRSNAGRLRLQFDLLSMLIRPCLEKNVITVFSFKPGNTVCQYNFINISNMRFPGCISDRCGDIIFPFIHFPFSFRFCRYP